LSFALCFVLFSKCFGQLNIQFKKDIVLGADQVDVYASMLQNKKVGFCGNQTSILTNKTHVIDTLLSLKVDIQKLFTPEHGLRGTADAGERVANSIDKKTGLPIISLYGKNKKPTAEQLKGIEIMVFDLQDVGARFYTYISTLHYVMEACSQNNIHLIVLDRPNPNGFYVDGPVLDTSLRSFVGMHPVPIVHGMTIGEYAQMINGEKWTKANSACSLTVIKCKNYRHTDYYELPVNPSPNLNSMQAIYLYPTTCLLEGTAMSVGRGTKEPFRNIGMPGFKHGKNYFTPVSTAGAKEPKYMNIKCRGIYLSDSLVNAFLEKPEIQISLIRYCYSKSANPKTFFPEKGSFNILAGDKNLKRQIKNSTQTSATWKPQLDKFKTIRKKYLLYPDYE
jgi:uncharacterized protein YbbC (DUF1343 family)